VVLGLIVVLLAGSALAFGTVRIRNTRPEEVDGTWKIKFDVDYGSKPHLGHIPMILSFEHVRQHEWCLTDQSPEKPVLNIRPLHNQTPINVPVDMGFADMRGEIHRKTRFDIKLRRDNDFEAGEYVLTIKRASDRATLGRPIRLTLQGQNKPVDRRSIVFTADSPNDKKPSDDPAASTDGAADKPKYDPADDPEPGYVDDLVATDPDDPTEAPPPVEPKQGGCGCRLEGRGGGDPERALWAAAALGLGLVVLGRRRRR